MPDNYSIDNVMDAMRSKKAPKEKNICVSFFAHFSFLKTTKKLKRYFCKI